MGSHRALAAALVDAGLIIGAPFIGSAVSAVALELNGSSTVGFAGINRLHFLWLWIAASLYAIAIISPLMNWLSSQFLDYFEANRLKAIVHTIIYAVPVFGFAFSAFGGLLVLTGQTGRSRTVKNIVGPVILVIGWVVSAYISFYWDKLVGWFLG